MTIIHFHTPEGLIEKDTDTMTDEEMDRLGYYKLHRAEELLATNPAMITPPELSELVKIMAVWIGMIPRPPG